MKKSTAKTTMAIIAIGTTGLVMAMPTIIHQLVVWVAGLFSLVAVLAGFIIDAVTKNTAAKPAPDFLTEAQVIVMRHHKCSDEYIAKSLGISVETVKGMGV